MLNILITGATGYLGKHLMKKLKELGYKIYISNTTQASLGDVKNLSIYDSIQFDYIFHLATKTKAGDYCLYHKGEQWIDNQILNTNILKYWKENQPKAKMVVMGTSCSYSPEYVNDMREENYLLGEPDEGLYTYAMTKRMLLVGLRSLSEQYGLEWVYLVPSTIYGPNFELSDSHFIFDLIKKISHGKYDNGEVELWGDGYQKRELIYVDDVINIMVALKDVKNEIINLGTGKEFTIRDYAKVVADILYFDENLIKYNVDKYIGVRSKKLNVDRLINNLPNDFEFTQLKVGINKTVEYYLDAKYDKKNKIAV